MLESLRVRNFVLIDDVELRLEPGLTVITGETGAGKSLLVGALSLILGERVVGDAVRAGQSQASVEATFHCDPRSRVGQAVADMLAQVGIEHEDGALHIRRVIGADGRSRCFVNGAAVVLKQISALSELLVDLHGQHEHQSLLRPAIYLDLLDAFGGLEEQAAAFGRAYAERETLREEIAVLSSDEEARLRELDMLRYQIGEIEAAEVSDPDEEAQLTAQRQVLRHAQTLHTAAAQAFALLAGSEQSAGEFLAAAVAHVDEMTHVDPTLVPLAEQLESARTTIEEVARTLQNYDQALEHEPGRLDAIETRLHQLNLLRRKYGATLADVMAFAERARARCQILEHADTRRAELESVLAKVEAALATAAVQLHQAREAAGGKLARSVERTLEKLALADARFVVALRVTEASDGLLLADGRRVRVGARGIDQADFLLAANPGMAPGPLRQVASGGELSRTMLALKTALAQASCVPTLLFDEVDAGIGGRTADAVGEALHTLAERFQVLCITHLPQLAARADHHFVVEKQTRGRDTRITVRGLTGAERKAELVRMLGGQEDSPEVARHAQLLLRGKGKFTTRETPPQPR